MLVPDDVQARLYKSDVAAKPRAGNCLMFAHGFNIHFNQIVPPRMSTCSWSRRRAPATSCARQYRRGQAAYPR